MAAHERGRPRQVLLYFDRVFAEGQEIYTNMNFVSFQSDVKELYNMNVFVQTQLSTDRRV